jgi:hypothetical protein
MMRIGEVLHSAQYAASRYCALRPCVPLIAEKVRTAYPTWLPVDETQRLQEDPPEIVHAVVALTEMAK